MIAKTPHQRRRLLRASRRPGLGVGIDEDQLARLEEPNVKEGDPVFHGEGEGRSEPPYSGMW
jgi:hypothetical protein